MRGGGDFDWTDDAVAALRKHHAAGLSATMIMRTLGCSSRNAVIGKINRLGLRRNLNDGPHICVKSGGTGTPRARSWTAQKLERKNLGLPSHFASPATRSATRSAPKPPPRAKLKSDGTLASYFAPTQPKLRPEPAEAQPIRVTITELTAASCRWPLGDPSDLDTFRYCGARVDLPGVVPYCAGHCRLAYARAA